MVSERGRAKKFGGPLDIALSNKPPMLEPVEPRILQHHD
jgi:hypothetical protein